MTIQNLIKELNQIIPFQQAEDFDNVGLLCGNPEREITGVLICHDALESVVEEAVQKNANVILTFHPIIFSISVIKCLIVIFLIKRICLSIFMIKYSYKWL